MARIHVPYARARGRFALASALIVSSVAAAALVSLPAFGAQSSSGPADSGVAAARLRVRQIEQQLVAVQDSASQSAATYGAADARVASLKAAIAANRQDLAQTKLSIKSSQAALARRIVSIYTDPPPTLVQVLVSTGSISSALDSYDLLRHIANQDMGLVRRFESDRSRLESLGTALRTDAAAAEANRTTAAAQLVALRGLAGQRSDLLGAATHDLSLAQASAAQLAVLRAERAAAAAASTAHSTPAQAVGGSGSQSGDSQGTGSQGSGSQGSGGQGSGSQGSGSQGSGGQGSGAGSGGGVPTGSLYAILTRIAMCESGGNPHAISPGGMYRGLFQFSMATWAAIGGTGDPAQASVAEQYRLAAILYERSGSGQWPVCGAR